MKEKVEKLSFRVEKNRLLQIGIFFILMTVLFVMYFAISFQLEKKFVVISDDYSWVYQVDEIKKENNQLVITGFAFLLEEDSVREKYEIILYNTRTGKGYFPQMSFCSREDVNSYFLCEYDYSESGFIAKIDLKKLDLKNDTYEILLRRVGTRGAYSTGTYYAAGEMMFTNPEEFVPLETVGTDLERITANGVLRVYRPDFGMYIYQYEGNLYWIAEPDYGFVDEDTLIQFQMDTTQIEKLPENRLANNWFWSNISFRFKSKELVEWNTGKYRVTKCELPTEYSITKIETGNYIGGWIWRHFFRPRYEFL